MGTNTLTRGFSRKNLIENTNKISLVKSPNSYIISMEEYLVFIYRLAKINF